MGLRAGVNAEKKRNITFFRGEPTPDKYILE
jgi:hypothetical protein